MLQKNDRRWRKKILLLTALVSGCAANVAPADETPAATSTEQTPEESARSQRAENSPSQAMKLIAEIELSHTNKVSIYEGAEGSLGVAVSGKIGVDDPARTAELLDDRSLSDLYLEFHPQADSAPAALTAVDERMAAERQAIAEGVSSELRDEAHSGLVEKSASAFYAWMCNNYSVSGGRYYADECHFGRIFEGMAYATGKGYQVVFGGLLGSDYDDVSPWPVTGRDRTYGWNETSDPTVIALVECGNSEWGRVRSTYTIAPGYWSYATWSLPWYATWCAEMGFATYKSGRFGDVGLTLHNWVPDSPR